MLYMGKSKMSSLIIGLFALVSLTFTAGCETNGKEVEVSFLQFKAGEVSNKPDPKTVNGFTGVVRGNDVVTDGDMQSVLVPRYEPESQMPSVYEPETQTPTMYERDESTGEPTGILGFFKKWRSQPDVQEISYSEEVEMNGFDGCVEDLHEPSLYGSGNYDIVHTCGDVTYVTVLRRSDDVVMKPTFIMEGAHY